MAHDYKQQCSEALGACTSQRKRNVNPVPFNRRATPGSAVHERLRATTVQQWGLLDDSLAIQGFTRASAPYSHQLQYGHHGDTGTPSVRALKRHPQVEQPLDKAPAGRPKHSRRETVLGHQHI